MRFLLLRRHRIGFHRRLGDAAPTAFDDGRLICHAALTKPVPALALVVAVIPAHLGIRSITAVRFTLLFQPFLTPALITAVRLSAVARPAYEKHSSTADRAAEQLSKRH